MRRILKFEINMGEIFLLGNEMIIFFLSIEIQFNALKSNYDT